jgi:hypothetical protein
MRGKMVRGCPTRLSPTLCYVVEVKRAGIMQGICYLGTLVCTQSLCILLSTSVYVTSHA